MHTANKMAKFESGGAAAAAAAAAAVLRTVLLASAANYQKQLIKYKNIQADPWTMRGVPVLEL